MVSNREQISQTRDVLMDWDTWSMRYVLKEFPSINQLRVVAQSQLIAEGARVRDVNSSSESTVAIEQATSKYQAFEGARSQCVDLPPGRPRVDGLGSRCST